MVSNGEAKQEETTSTEDSHEAVAKHSDGAVEKKMEVISGSYCSSG